MPPRQRRARFAAPDSYEEPVDMQPEDTSGDVAMARRIQRELDEERNEARRRAEQVRAVQRQREEANRREAIRQVAADLGEPMDLMDMRARLLALHPGIGGNHFGFGNAFHNVIQRFAPGANPGLAAILAHMPPAQMGPDPRAVQEQNIRDSWAGISFVPRQNPLLGFTFDFDKDAEESTEPTEIVRLDFDDDAPIIEELKASGTSGKAGGGKHSAIPIKDDGLTSLVCASCHMPLRVSQGQRNEGDRVFSLQCGHLVDKRCLDDISQPKPENGNDEQERKPGFIKVGAGSTSRADGFVVNGEYSETPLASTSTLPRIKSPSSPPNPMSSPPVAEIAGNPSKRTRSAMKRAAPEPVGEESDSHEEVMDDLDFPPMRASRKVRGKKRKAAAVRPKRTAALKKLAKPEEKREFKWLCPVLACGREHYSEEIGGVWKPKDGMTVQLFV